MNLILVFLSIQNNIDIHLMRNLCRETLLPLKWSHEKWKRTCETYTRHIQVNWTTIYKVLWRHLQGNIIMEQSSVKSSCQIFNNQVKIQIKILLGP